MYIYQADTYCDDCGLAIMQDLKDQGWTEPTVTPDSDDWPVYAPDDQEVDYPGHCANGVFCKDPVDLTDYGLSPNAALYGAETRLIGSLLSDNLTSEGVDYLVEMLTDENLSEVTPYQQALHNYWREAFAAYLNEEL